MAAREGVVWENISGACLSFHYVMWMITAVSRVVLKVPCSCGQVYRRDSEEAGY